MSKMTLEQWRDRLTDPLPLLPIELKDLANAIDAELKWQADVSGAGQGRKFRKKPVVIEASQWYQSGDHDAVQPMPDVDSLRDWQCSQCGHHLARHGRVLTLEGDHIVCPGTGSSQALQASTTPASQASLMQRMNEWRIRDEQVLSWPLETDGASPWLLGQDQDQ